jgi:hypothetical protein
VEIPEGGIMNGAFPKPAALSAQSRVQPHQHDGRINSQGAQRSGSWRFDRLSWIPATGVN